MKKRELIQALEPFDDDLPIVINNQAGLPFTYEVTGVMSEGNFDLAHLFDRSQPAPEARAIYLLVRVAPGPPGYERA